MKTRPDEFPDSELFSPEIGGLLFYTVDYNHFIKKPTYRHAMNFEAFCGVKLVMSHPEIYGGRNPRSPPCRHIHQVQAMKTLGLEGCVIHTGRSEFGLKGYLAHKNPPPVGPYNSPIPKDLWWSWWGQNFLWARYPCTYTNRMMSIVGFKYTNEKTQDLCIYRGTSLIRKRPPP